LLPYDKVDANIKKANRETASDTVKTLLAYGYQIEPPSQEFEDNLAKRASGIIIYLYYYTHRRCMTIDVTLFTFDCYCYDVISYKIY
jgi:hypothetical protein